MPRRSASFPATSSPTVPGPLPSSRSLSSWRGRCQAGDRRVPMTRESLQAGHSSSRSSGKRAAGDGAGEQLSQGREPGLTGPAGRGGLSGGRTEGRGCGLELINTRGWPRTCSDRITQTHPGDAHLGWGSSSCGAQGTANVSVITTKLYRLKPLRLPSCPQLPPLPSCCLPPASVPWRHAETSHVTMGCGTCLAN